MRMGRSTEQLQFCQETVEGMALGEVELLQRQNSDAHRPVSDGKFGARVHLVQRPCTLWSALGGLLARARSETAVAPGSGGCQCMYAYGLNPKQGRVMHSCTSITSVHRRPYRLYEISLTPFFFAFGLASDR